MDQFLSLTDVVEYIERLDKWIDHGEVQAIEVKQVPVLRPPAGMKKPEIKQLVAKTSKVQRRNTSKSFPHLLRVRRGQYTGTWAHPFLAIKLAAWIDKDFEIAMHKTLFDGLLELRDQSGESYKSMCQAILISYGPFHNGEAPEIFSQIGFYIQDQIFGCFSVGVWENATKEQLGRRDKIHDEITNGAKWAAKGKIPLEEFLSGTIAEN